MGNVEIAKAARRLLSAAVVSSAMDSSLSGRKVGADAIQQLVNNGMPPRGVSIRSVIWQCDRWLRRNYRNEHVYRSVVLSELLRERGVRTIPEFRVNSSQADFLVVGSGLHVVEVKSELDSLSRLGQQVDDYRQVAPLVSVVAPLRLARKVLEQDTFRNLGVSVLTAEVGGIEILRSATHDTEHLDASTMMRSLRRAEYMRVLDAMGRTIPRLPNTQVFGEVLAISRTLDPIIYHDRMAEELGKRRPRAGSAAMARVPMPLMPVVLRLNPGRPQLDRLQVWLNSEVDRVLA